ncbi:AMP-binding protein [Halobacillus sp. Marseille-Q1614]|uniref:AMP-binding protein n=1 Tax=Halobacillus sp. Marseille-Q1614 TaxID=2709134 RepID=UPI00156F0719|nr:AMP-binding protein [Halobacillus sp. Marseille-Q1614]
MAYIGERIRETAENYPNRIAIKSGDESITYESFYQFSRLLQEKIQSIYPNGKGRKIGFMLANGPTWLEVFIAISQSGDIALPFDPKWSDSQLENVIDDAQPDLIIYDHSFVQRLEGLQGAVLVDDLFKHSSERGAAGPLSDKDPFYIGYTSGTTGQPKGFVRSHASWANCFSRGRDVFSIDASQQILCPGPLVHSHFLYAAVQALHIGASLHLQPSFDAEEALQLINKEEIAVMYIVPTMFEAVKRVKGVQNLSSLTTMISSGAKWPTSSKKEALQLFPQASLYEFYGASELSFVSYRLIHETTIDKESIGTPFPEVEISILREDGEPAEHGEVGQLYVKSPWVFDGYLNRPEETKQVFHGEWATVGDLAFIDEEGQIILKGRKQNMIISGGLNIYPEEVEQVILTHPAIQEAVVKGIEDDYWGEKVVAFVKVNKGNSLNFEDLKNLLISKIPKYKCPKEWVELDEFPYTSSGKIARKELVIPSRRD